jgi:hypothetical protein
MIDQSQSINRSSLSLSPFLCDTASTHQPPKDTNPQKKPLGVGTGWAEEEA